MEESKLTFETPEISSGILAGLHEQQKQSKFCDLTLYVNNRVIKVHRNVLACGSPYFASILKHHKIVKEQLTISCLNTDIFDCFVTYMYTGRLTIQASNVEEFLRLANHFFVSKITEYCTQYLEKTLNANNCLFVVNLAQKYNLKNISQLDNLISAKLNEIVAPDVLNLPSDKLQNLFKYKGLNVTVTKFLDILTRWVLKDRQAREKEFNGLLNCVQWINVDHNDISKHLDTCCLYENSDRCLYQMLSALVQNNVLLPNYKNRYEELHYKYTQSYNESGSSEEKTEDKTDSGTSDAKEEDSSNDTDKGAIRVKETPDVEPDDKKSNLKMLVVQTKQKNYRQRFIRRLMLYGLRSNLRIASMKNVFCKKKLSVVNISKRIEEVYSDEKFGVKCPVCSTVINDSLLLEQHLALSHAKDVTYKCGICSFVCQYHGDYLTHMKNHFPGPPYKCDYCDHTTDQISKLLTHRAKHSDEMVYACTWCSFRCRVKQNLLAHLRLHAAQRERRHRCDLCHKAYRHRHSLDAHVMTHAPEKTLSCDTCGFSTKYLSHMIAHKRMHSGDVYRCSFPHCKYSTSKKNQLTSHAKTHNGVRPHNCGVCGRGFMEKSHLVRHERIHLDEKPFKCSQCDYASSRRDKLKEHFTRHHGENASAKVPYKARPLRNGTANNAGRSSKAQESTTNGTPLNFTPPATNPTPANAAQPIGNEIQDLIMHHQNHPSSSAAGGLPTLNHNYHHFPEPGDFHPHHHHAPPHAHNIPHQLLGGHGSAAQRAAAAAAAGQHQAAAAAAAANHHMALGRAGGATHPAASAAAASSTAAAVAAAMMLDPRFHHNGSVPYHPNSTPVSMAMAAVQSSQQIQGSGQHGEYPPSLQNCMTLF